MSDIRNSSDVSRRELLVATALAGASSLLQEAVSAHQTSFRALTKPKEKSTTEAMVGYLATRMRSDGGCAWYDEPQSHLTPTFAVVGCCHLLKDQEGAKKLLTFLPNKKIADFVRNNHPFKIKKLEREMHYFEFQQIQSLLWLGEDVTGFRDQVRSWKKPTVYAKQYEKSGNPVFHYELQAFICRALLGLPLDDLDSSFLKYLDSRRRADGSYNATPAQDGSGGHVMNTWWGLQALRALGRIEEKKEETVKWLRACQLPSGGFTYQPKPEFAGIENAVYTWAAVRSLKALDAAPSNREACIRYLHSLWNADGGCGERPDWQSNPMATYYVLDALDALKASTPATLTKTAPRIEPLPNKLQVFSIQIQAHGQGSPAEAVDLARGLKIDMWGAKNSKPGWIKRAQELADEQKVPVTFFVANEEYNTWVRVPGLGTYSHTSDIMAPPGSDFGESLANKGVATWPEYREKRLAPLTKADGRLYWQFGENEEIVRLYLDDSLQRGGYSAISTFHFGNPDFTNSEPFLQQYRGQIPYIALQDAHGPEPWWFADMTTGFRTLFLGEKANWESWLRALRNNWVVAFREDAVSGGKRWMHGGSDEVVAFAWKQWNTGFIDRPLVSIVAVNPKDEFEVARPAKGVTIRVRCAWENTTQGAPKKPLVELEQLLLDGNEVKPKLVEKKAAGKGAAFADVYHELHLPEPAPGKHLVRAMLRVLATKKKATRIVEFRV